MTQAGYAGNPRYNVVPAALACALAGIGVAALVRPVAGRVALAAALAAATLVFTAGDLTDQVDELGARADRREQLDALVRDVGGKETVASCARPRTNQPMKAMLAWRLDHPMRELADPPADPAAVFQAPPGYAGEPPAPRTGDPFETVATVGDWTLAAACVLDDARDVFP
jgi:hypothetical protein